MVVDIPPMQVGTRQPPLKFHEQRPIEAPDVENGRLLSKQLLREQLSLQEGAGNGGRISLDHQGVTRLCAAGVGLASEQLFDVSPDCLVDAREEHAARSALADLAVRLHRGEIMMPEEWMPRTLPVDL